MADHEPPLKHSDEIAAELEAARAEHERWMEASDIYAGMLATPLTNTCPKLSVVLKMSCSRFPWTPICPIGDRHDEVQHGPAFDLGFDTPACGFPGRRASL